MERIEDKQRWFVFDSYHTAGRPKLEAMLIHYAEQKYMNCLISEDVLTDVVNDINEEQESLSALNKRMKKVEIGLSDGFSYSYNEIRSIQIGDCSLRLKRVNAVFQEI